MARQQRGDPVTGVDLVVGGANFGRGVSGPAFRANLHRFLSAARAMGPAAVGLQEIDEADRADERAALRRWTRYRPVGLTTGVPVLVDRDLELVDRGVAVATEGLAGYTPRRFITTAVLQMPGADWLPPVAFLNTHVPIDRPVTQSRRRRVRRRLRARAVWHQLRGRVVVWVADTNTRGRFPVMLPGELVLYRVGVDEGRLSVPRGIRAQVVRRAVVDLDIDRHDGHLVTVRLTRRRAGRP